MFYCRLLCIFFAIFIFIKPLYVWAQNNIEERVNNNKEPVIVRNDEPLFIDNNLVLLKRPKLFTAYAVPSIQYTNNAFLSPTNRQKDVIYALNSGVNFGLKTANNIQFNAGISASKYEYQKNSSLGYNTLQGNINLSYTIKKFMISAGYTPAVVLQKDFNNRIITLNSYNIGVSRNFQIGNRILLSPYSNIGYTKSNPSDFSYYQFSSGLSASYFFTPKVYLSVTPEIYQKSYKDFFEDRTGIARVDTGSRTSLNLSYSPKENINFSARMGYNFNQSTLEGNGFINQTITPSVRFSYRF